MPTHVKISIEPASANYFLNKSDRYKYSTVVITTWLTVTKYPYLTSQWNISLTELLSFLYQKQHLYRTWLCVPRWCLMRSRKCLTFESTWGPPPRCLVGSVLLIFLAFFVFVLCCVPNVVWLLVSPFVLNNGSVLFALTYYASLSS
jgi:hypothetical protein